MRLVVRAVLAVCALGGVARANDLVIAPAERVIGRGALTVVSAGDETHHHVYLRDQHERSLDLMIDDPFAATRATVTPFLGERGLYHVTVFVHDAQQPYHVEHHYLVRFGAEPQIACQFEGNVAVPPEPDKQVTVRKVTSRPLVFDVDTRSGGTTQRARYTMAPGEPCSDPAAVAATAPGDGARISAAMRTHKYRDVQIISIAGPGSFVALGVRGKPDAPNEDLVLVTPAAPQPVLELGRAGLHDERDGVHVLSYAPFLDSKELLDLNIAVSWSNGFGGSTTATHYILRRPRAPELACVVAGDSSGGMEDVNHSSSVSFAKTGEDPFSFTTSHIDSEGRRGMQGIGGGPTEPPCVIPARGRCKCGMASGPD